MYSEKVVDYFMNPRNAGKLEDANAIGEVGNPKCGDVMKIYLKINDNEIIEDIKFETFGCAAAIATSSMITEMVKGKTISEALKINNKDVAEALGGLPGKTPLLAPCPGRNRGSGGRLLHPQDRQGSRRL